MHGFVLAAMALIPMVNGPAPREQDVLTAKLCGGGEVSIPIGGDQPDSGPDCHQKACHAGTCRQKIKKAV